MYMQNDSVAILGHFGEKRNLLNGQTIKTSNLVEGLTKYGNLEVCKIDSHGWTKHPWLLLKQIRVAFMTCDAIIMLPAQNGVRVFAPLLIYYKKKYGKKVFYDVIGGWLPAFLRSKHYLQNVLKKMCIRDRPCSMQKNGSFHLKRKSGSARPPCTGRSWSI